MTVLLNAEKYEKQLAELRAQESELMIQCDVDGEITPENQTRLNELDAKIKNVDKMHKRILEHNNQATGGQHNNGGTGAGNGNNGGGMTFPPEPGTHQNNGGVPAHFQIPGSKKPQITNQKESFEDDPKFGYRNSEEFFAAVIDFGKRSQEMSYQSAANGDHRLMALSTLRNANQTSSEYMNAQTSEGKAAVTGDMTGSVFVPVEFAPEMFKTEAVMPSGAFNTNRRTSKSLSVHKRYRLDKDHRESVTGGFQVGRNFEMCCNRSSAADYAEYQVTLSPLYGAYVASDMLLEVNPQMIAQEVQEGFRTEFEANRIIEILNGQGNGEYHGIWNSSATIKVDPVSGPTAPKTVGSTTLTKEDVYKMTERIWHNGNRGGMVWVAGLKYKTPLKTLMDARQDGSNYFLYSAGAGPEWADGMLDGYPIVFTEFVGPIGFQGSLGLYNMQEFEEYTWKPIKMASSVHAKFICNQTVMKFWTYTGGRPRWDSTLIPKGLDKDADAATVAENTLSPFVLWDGDNANKPKTSKIHNKS